MRAFLVFLIALVGVAAIVAGVVYLVVPAHSLPTFMPGHLAGSNGKHPKRGYVCLGVGAVLIIASIVIGMAGQARRHGSLR
jgi:hypothetical protein